MSDQPNTIRLKGIASYPNPLDGGTVNIDIQPSPITDDEIRSVLYRMAAHVSFFAEPCTPDPKAVAFADALMSTVRPPVQKAGHPDDTPTERDGVLIPSADYAFLSKGLRDLDSALNGFSRLNRDRCGDLTSQLRDILPATPKPSPDREPETKGTLRSIDAVITILGEYRNEVGYISECTTVADIINHRI